MSSLHQQILLIQMIIIAASIGAIFYTHIIPKKESLADINIRISPFILIIAFVVWLCIYLILHSLTYILGTGWFLGLFITFYLALTNRTKIVFNVLLSLIIALFLTLVAAFSNLSYLNNLIIIIALSRSCCAIQSVCKYIIQIYCF